MAEADHFGPSSRLLARCKCALAPPVSRLAHYINYMQPTTTTMTSAQISLAFSSYSIRSGLASRRIAIKIERGSSLLLKSNREKPSRSVCLSIYLASLAFDSGAGRGRSKLRSYGAISSEGVLFCLCSKLIYSLMETKFSGFR